MKHRFLNYAAAAVLATGITLAQTAPANPPAGAPGHPGRQAMMQRRFTRMAAALNLTDSQKEQAKAAFSQAREAAQPVMQQLKQNRQALADAVKAGKSDAEIRDLSNQTGALVGQLTAIRSEAFAKVYATLTPEQRTKADQLHEQMKNRFENWRGGRRTNG